MKVRTITLQVKPEYGRADAIYSIKKLRPLTERFEELYGSAPRTSRIVSSKVRDDIHSAIDIVTACKKEKVWGVCIPIDLAFNPSLTIEAANLMTFDESVFINLVPVNQKDVALEAVKASAEFIIKQSLKDPMLNFRIGVASVSENKTPFFPFSAAVNHNEFTVGLEIIDLFLNIIKENDRKSISEIREALEQGLSTEVYRLNNICLGLADEFDMTYGGVDLSIAPYPYPLEEQSVATLIEKFGNIGRSRGEPIYEFGGNGTYFLNAFLTKILKSVARTQMGVGFNGVMYSLLEDTYLSMRYEEETFDIDTLKLLSTSCGCGIDMVPLCGDTDVNAIQSIILDNITASILLDKPLGVRVLPIPDSRVGDRTKFKHLFFANTTIRQVGRGSAIQNLPAQDSIYRLG